MKLLIKNATQSHSNMKIKYTYTAILSYLVLIAMVICVGCSSIQQSQISENNPAGHTPSVFKSKENSEIKIEKLQKQTPKESALITFTLPNIEVTSVNIFYGTDKNQLTLSKRVSISELIKSDPNTNTFKYELRDIQNISPLYVSIVTEAGGFSSPKSPVVKVE